MRFDQTTGAPSSQLFSLVKHNIIAPVYA